MENQKPPIVPNADTASLGPAAAINDAADLDLAHPDDEREDELPEHERDDVVDEPDELNPTTHLPG